MTVMWPYYFVAGKIRRYSAMIVCWVEVDLLGELLCTLTYGGINSPHGQVKKNGIILGKGSEAPD